MTVTYRTIVLDNTPSPHGLSPARTIIDPYCNLCRQQIDTSQLADHARSHHPQPKITPRDQPID